jgi:hypothetical protein
LSVLSRSGKDPKTSRPPYDLRGAPHMPDLAFLAIAAAVFVVLALIVKGVEKL